MPRFIYITIQLKDGKGKIEFILHPDLRDTNALLNAFRNFLLGGGFPDNLETLAVEPGGLGAPVWLKNGKLVLGNREFPLHEVPSFSMGNNGFYTLKLAFIKQTLGITPDNAPNNIVSTLKIMDAITNRS